jgi:hypothetical protein
MIKRFYTGHDMKLMTAEEMIKYMKTWFNVDEMKQLENWMEITSHLSTFSYSSVDKIYCIIESK